MSGGPGSESDRGVDLGIPGCEDAVEIGRGGFGVVYRARQPEFERTVAIKVLSGGVLDAEARGRFARELRAMGALSGHPNIVTVHHAGFTASGRIYLVMGFEEGGSLADRLLIAGVVPWEEAVALGVRLAGALERASRRRPPPRREARERPGLDLRGAEARRLRGCTGAGLEPDAR
jgi:hypothetical protein